jgi:hypothetical protein
MAIPKLFTPDETAALIRIRRNTLDKWRCIGRGLIPHVKLGGRIYYTEEAIEKFIRCNTHGEQPQAANAHSSCSSGGRPPALRSQGNPH